MELRLVGCLLNEYLTLCYSAFTY